MTVLLAITALFSGGLPFGRLLYTVFGTLSERGGHLPALVLWQRGYPRLALATALAETLKIGAVYAVTLQGGGSPTVAAQALGVALLGHLFSPWLWGRPSFSVAPFMGVLLVCGVWPWGVGGALWWYVWRKTGQSAWAAIATLSCIPLLSYATGYDAVTLSTLPLVLWGLLWQSRYVRI